MAIYNLGTLPTTENPWSEYLKLLMEHSMKKNLLRQETAARKEIATAQGEAEAKTFLAKRELEQVDATRKNLTATWQSLSDKPENERKLFVETDQGKEYLKTVKKYIPELFDDNSNPIFFPSTKDTIKQEIDSKINVVKNKLLTSGPGSLNEGETSILQMEGYKDEIAQVTADLYKNPEFIYLMEENPEKAQQMAQQALKQRITLRKSMQGGGANINELSSALGGGRQPLFYGPNAMFPGAGSTPISQEATPQKTRFKVRRLP